MATVIYTNGETKEVQPANGTDFQLAELQALVLGHIEIVPVRGDPAHILVCNEESKLLGMERNERATELAGLPTALDRWRIKLMLQEQGVHVIDMTDPAEDDYVAGPCLYCLDSEVQ